MPTEYTPAQIAALAAELGITPETHPWLNWYQWHSGKWELRGLARINPFDPTADPREVDQCWLPRLMWYAADKGYSVESWIQGRCCLIKVNGHPDTYVGDNFSSLMILFLIAARAPVIVAALATKETDHD